MRLLVRAGGFLLGLVILTVTLIGFVPVQWLVASHAIAQWRLSPVLMAFAVAMFANPPLSVLCFYVSAIGTVRELSRSRLLTTGELLPLPLTAVASELPPELVDDLRGGPAQLFWQLPRARKRLQPALLFAYRPATCPAATEYVPPGTAFIGAHGARVVVFRDMHASPLRPWQRFMLLHELAHVSSDGVRLSVVRWRFIATTANTLVVFVIMCWNSAALWSWCAFGVFGLWVYFRFWRRFSYMAETYADLYAFTALKDDGERSNVIALMEREVKLSAEGPHNAHHRLWSARLSCLIRGPRPSLMNPQGSPATDPSAVPFVLMSLAAAWVGWHTPAQSTLQIVLLAVWCVICQAAGVLLLGLATHAETQLGGTIQARVDRDRLLDPALS